MDKFNYNFIEKFIIKLIGYVFLIISLWGFVIIYNDNYISHSNNKIYKEKAVLEQLDPASNLERDSTIQSISIRNSNFPILIGLFAISGAIMVVFSPPNKNQKE